MKKVWLAQLTRTKNNAIFLPYSVGTIAAYAWQFPEIKQNYSLQDFILFMDSIDEICAKIDDAYLVAFSSYMWNVDYNISIAKRIKEKNPNTLIVFGGPDIPENASFLEKYPFIDILIFGEGEEPFYGILAAFLKGNDLSAVNSIAYRKGDKVVLNPIVTPLNIKNYPSPYTEGYFDHILHDPAHKGMQFDVIMETNRGCPYKCLYCSWGTKDAPVRKFSMERILGEIHWMKENKIVYCFFADGNFGLFDRDEKIADYIIEQKRECGFPQISEIIAAKQKNDVVFRINKKMNDIGLNKGVSLTCQTLTPQVLKNIHRQNMSAESFAQQVQLYRDAGMFTYTEMILGLPGETYESFCKSILNVYETGQHLLVVYLCYLLPCAPMAQPEIIRKYDIKTVRADLSLIHTDVREENTNPSYCEVVVHTNTMSTNDWLNMNVVAVCAQAVHGFGLYKYFAVYARRALNIPFHDFYMDYIHYLRYENDYTAKIIRDVTASFATFLKGESSICYYDRRFGEMYLDINEAVFACFAAESEVFYKQTAAFMSKYIADKELLADLMHYQVSKIVFPFVKAHDETFQYDWEAFFADIYNNTPKQPVKKRCAVHFETEYFDNLVDYTRDVIWFGKRKGRFFVKSERISD